MVARVSIKKTDATAVHGPVSRRLLSARAGTNWSSTDGHLWTPLSMRSANSPCIGDRRV